MPIPKPTPDEEQKDFISRCMGNDVMNTEYPDEKQRSAICYASWKDNGKKGLRGGDRGGAHDRPLKENMQLELEDISGKIIAYPGKFGKGKEIKESDIDDMIRNFNEKINEPYLNLDHDDTLTDKVQDALKVARLGTISKLYKVGGKLVADFVGIPKKIAEMIKGNLINQRSIEMFRKIERAGKVYNNVLHAVSFFGKQLPAIPHLDDYIPALYEFEEKPIKVEFKENRMEKVEISKEEYDRLKKSDSDFTTFRAAKENADLVKLQTQVSEDAERIKTLEKIKSELTAFYDKAIAEKKERIITDADDFLKKNATKFEPRYREDYKADYLRFAKEDPDRLERFKTEIESRSSLIGDNILDPGDPKGNVKVDFNKEETIEAAIDVLINTGKAKNWTEGRKMVFEKYGREVD